MRFCTTGFHCFYIYIMLSLLQAENEKQMKQSEGRFRASVISFKPVKSNLIMYRLMCVCKGQGFKGNGCFAYNNSHS